MPRTKDGGFVLNEPDAAKGPYSVKKKQNGKTEGKKKKQDKSKAKK